MFIRSLYWHCTRFLQRLPPVKLSYYEERVLPYTPPGTMTLSLRLWIETLYITGEGESEQNRRCPGDGETGTKVEFFSGAISLRRH